MYFASTAVVMSELVKLITCFLLVYMEESFSLSSFYRNLKTNIIQDPWDCLLISVPGIVYTVQNNLLFVGYSYLPAVSFQVSDIFMHASGVSSCGDIANAKYDFVHITGYTHFGCICLGVLWNGMIP